MNKLSKILIIFAGAVFVGALVYAGWSYFFSEKSGPNLSGTPDAVSSTGATPIKKIADERIFGYWLNKAGDLYVVNAENEIKKIAADGSIEDLASKVTGEPSKITPTADGKLALFRLSGMQNISYAAYDTATKGWFGLPAGTESAAWDPASNNRIAYLRTANNATRLYFFDVSKKTSQDLGLINLKDVELTWPTPNYLHFTERPTNEYATNAWAYNIKNKTFSFFERDKKALSVVWNNSGKAGVQLANGTLTLINETGATLTTLDLKTMPGKCAFADLRLYCAASIDESSLSANFADSYLRLSQRDPENVHLISLIGLGAAVSPVSFKAFDALSEGIAIAVDQPTVYESSFYFINAFDGKLYALAL